MAPSTVKNIWMISREYGKIAGAGGVKDVVQQLATALAAGNKRRVHVVIPLYGFIEPGVHDLEPLYESGSSEVPLEFFVDMNYGLEERREKCGVWVTKSGKVTLYFIDAERYREKSNVYTYTDKEVAGRSWLRSGAGHYDYFAMNVLLQKSSLELMILLAEKPDVIHCHDGHTALLPALINECQGWQSYFRDTGCLVTIHNAGIGYHQEVADLPFAHGITGLPWSCIGENRLSGKFDPLLVAGQYAIVNTVSENYARELQLTDEDERTDWLGHTLRQRGVIIEGITNGICQADFDPSHGEQLGIPASFKPGGSKQSLTGKRVCKNTFLTQLEDGLELSGIDQYGALAADEDTPLFAFVGRLSEQKGVDLFLEAIGQLFGQNDNCQVVILGSGTDILEAAVLSLLDKEQMRGRCCFLRGYSPELANKLFAACDFFVIPSRYEPCGLTDYISQLFGAIPVVHHVGGLVKVEDGVTGIAYRGDTVEPLVGALSRALELYKDTPVIRAMQKEAIQRIGKRYSWKVVREQYVQLYIQAKQKRLQERHP